MVKRVFRERSAKNIERISCNAAKPVVCRPHYEFRSARNLAEFADYKFFPELRIVEQNIVLFKFRGSGGIIVISVVTDKNVRRLHNILHKAGSLVLIRKNLVRVRKPLGSQNILHRHKNSSGKISFIIIARFLGRLKARFLPNLHHSHFFR